MSHSNKIRRSVFTVFLVVLFAAGFCSCGKYKFTFLFGSHSLLLEYDQLLTKQDLNEQPKPNLALGWEIGTATHTFQMFITNYSQVINQRNLVFNTNDFIKGDYLVGFNITVRF